VESRQKKEEKTTRKEKENKKIMRELERRESR
jgi:hypothetical protein